MIKNNIEFKQFVMFDLQILNPNIWYWENALSFPDHLVDFIEEIDLNELSYNKITKWKNWTASDDTSIIYGATKNILSSELKSSTGSDATDKKTLYISNSFLMAFEMCSNRYLAGHGLDENDYRLELNHVPIKKWNQGQSMGPHFDGQDGNSDLAFSLVSYPNDNYEGGEINFPNQNITIKPKAGSMIMFPSQLPYLHEVKPIISGTRYMSSVHVYIK